MFVARFRLPLVADRIDVAVSGLCHMSDAKCPLHVARLALLFAPLVLLLCLFVLVPARPLLSVFRLWLRSAFCLCACVPRDCVSSCLPCLSACGVRTCTCAWVLSCLPVSRVSPVWIYGFLALKQVPAVEVQFGLSAPSFHPTCQEHCIAQPLT